MMKENLENKLIICNITDYRLQYQSINK